jgi:hypothetical protein
MSKLIEIDGLLRLPPEEQNGYADNNIIHPFKGRTINMDKPIDVYRNLNRKGKWYSVKQGGLVVAHTKAICVRDASFVVNESGKKRAIETNQRNVHAFIRGYFDVSGMGTSAKGRLPVKITYTPFSEKGFHIKDSGDEIRRARFLIVNEEGVQASYTF